MTNEETTKAAIKEMTIEHHRILMRDMIHILHRQGAIDPTEYTVTHEPLVCDWDGDEFKYACTLKVVKVTPP